MYSSEFENSLKLHGQYCECRYLYILIRISDDLPKVKSIALEKGFASYFVKNSTKK
jgi:hypothetical protein